MVKKYAGEDMANGEEAPRHGGQRRRTPRIRGMIFAQDTRLLEFPLGWQRGCTVRSPLPEPTLARLAGG